MKLVQYAALITLFSLNLAGIAAQNDGETATLPSITLEGNNKNAAYTFLYQDTRPADVPQRDYDGLWAIQKEVIDNFLFDLTVYNRNARSPYSRAPSKADFYRYGKGISGDYANFFLVLAREQGLAENLYKIIGTKGKDTHVWLEYRTKTNAYIIDPTWSDDYPIPAMLRQQFKATPAYGRRAFFTTYAEDKIIFHGHQNHDHSTYTNRQTEIWMD